MIVVYVEVWPNGDQSKARPVGSLGLQNVTREGDLLDQYVFEMDEAPNPSLKVDQLQHKGVIHAHNRNQSVWKLVRRAIDAVFPNIIT